MLDKLKIDKKILKQLDLSIIVLSIIIVIFGSLNIYSATVKKAGLGAYYFKLQMAWLILGLIVIYVILLIDYNILANYAVIIYWGGVSLLLYNNFFGSVVNGAQGWISLGSRAIQPAEFAKLGMIIILAKKLDDMEGNINNFKNFMILTFYAMVPMILIVIQPDMGMTMVCFFIVLGIFFMAGLNIKVILGGLAAIVTSIALVWNSSLMQEYWKKRLTTFLNPEADELGAGLQIIQSKIGIGSGNIIGQGVKFGYDSGASFVAQFVPEAFTDFIFAMVGEKWGFVGALFLLTLYSILIYRFILIARRSKDIFGMIICIGVVSSFLFSIIQNIGMTIGIMPVTGITLPLMSYGGSSILTNFMAIGLILNIGMRRKKINF
jgi:rod shape determining protein RodA